YEEAENNEYIMKASSLVDNGRAGKLNRLEEIVEYCKASKYSKIGVAYCYSMDKEALKLKEYLTKTGFECLMVACTVDGISESRVNKAKEKQIVSCNPLGQAYYLNKSGAQFLIIMGLCLGHDILLQKELKVDFTTFIVKDRVLRHNPILALYEGKLPEDIFLEELPDNFNIIKIEELEENLKSKIWIENTYIIDLRKSEDYNAEHIEGALNINLKQLPIAYKSIIPNKNKEIVVYCNGGIQSAYAAMYLSLKGYKSVKSLSGGYSS
ncbi:MAG: DUF1847 domain-containing protein, partial [Clostridiaceae bacterium]|nr:DUF1847 domain-containing protein [Clostridiaceae bacterium]